MKIRGAVVAFAAVLAVGAGSASANNGGGTYPPDPGDTGISVDKPVVETGDTITVSAHGLCKGTVVFELAGSSTVGLLLSPPVTVGDNGTASYTFTVPGPASQWYVAWAKQPDCQITLNTPVQVVDPGTNPPPPPPPPPAPKPTISAPDVTTSHTFNVSATNLCPGQQATFQAFLLGQPTASADVMAGSDGTAATTLTVSGPGTWTVQVYQFCGTTVSKPVKVENAAVAPAVEPAVVTPAVVTPAVVTPAVVAPAAVSPAVIVPAAAAPVAQALPSNLPATGSDPANMVQIAAFAVAAGLGMVMVTSMRRRKRTATISID